MTTGSYAAEITDPTTGDIVTLTAGSRSELESAIDNHFAACYFVTPDSADSADNTEPASPSPNPPSTSSADSADNAETSRHPDDGATR